MTSPLEKQRYAEIGRDARQPGAGPLYLRLADQLADRIENGQLMSGQALPPQRQLCRLVGVGEVTLRRALTDLARRRLVQARQGSGTLITGWMPGPLRQNRRPSRRELRIGVLSVASADGYPFIQPFLKAMAGFHSRRPGDPAITLQMFFQPGEWKTDALDAMLDDLDGLIQMSPASIPVLSACQQQSLPYVLLFNELVDGQSTCIWTDYGPGLLAAVRCLRKLGRQRIALVTAHPDRFSSGRMSDALRLSLQACDLPPESARIVAAGYSASQGEHITRQLLGDDPAPDAIFYASEDQARGGRIAIAEAGLRIPQDLSVITVSGNLKDASQKILAPDEGFHPPADERILRIDLNTSTLAQATGDALLAQHHRAPWPRRIAIPSRLMI